MSKAPPTVEQYSNRRSYSNQELSALRATFDKNTKMKVSSTKIYFQQYWSDVISYYKAREQREVHVVEQDDEVALANHRMSETDYLRVLRTRLFARDFDLLAILGRGGFGAVYLASKRDTNEIVALKKMKKDRYLQGNEVDKVHRERTVMASNDSPWLVQLKYSFQDEENIYLAMEYIPGGDMKNLLDTFQCFDLTQTQFYFSEMILAIGALHSIGYVHRDLKPDNFVITKQGHIKLIDFGLSKEGASFKNSTLNISKMNLRDHKKTHRRGRHRKERKIYSIVGSPEYMAKEILNESGYDHLVDYWSMGVILFELLFGVTPFDSDSIQETFAKIYDFESFLFIPEEDPEDSIEYNSDVTEESAVWDLIKSLICEPENRIGYNASPEEGLNLLKSHPFVATTDFDNMLDSKFIPFTPQLGGDELNIEYFKYSLEKEDFYDMGCKTLRDIHSMPDENIPHHLLGGIKFEKIPSSSRNDTVNLTRATKYKNRYKKAAFAGWTFRRFEPKDKPDTE